MNYDQVCRNLGTDLPPELLSNIFSRLALSDVKICRIVCRSWGWSASRRMAEMSSLDFRAHDEFIGAYKYACGTNEDPNYHNNSCETSQHGTISPMSLAAFKSLRLRQVCVSFSSDSIASRWIWGPIIGQLSVLILEKCRITESDFIRILRHCVGSTEESAQKSTTHLNSDEARSIDTCSEQCSNLKFLSLIDTRELFRPGTFLSEPDDKSIVSRAFSRLTKLDVSDNSYMTDALFGRLITCSPNLKTLKVNRISIQHHPGIYKKYYPDIDMSQLQNSQKKDVPQFNSSSIFTFGCLLHYLTHNVVQLKTLGLQGTDLPDTLLQRLSSLPNLCLSSLDISRNLGIKQSGMKYISLNQGNYLKELNISYCRRISMDYDPTLIQIFKHLSGLKKLVLWGLSFPRGFDECVSQLPSLEYLDIRDCDLPTKHLADGIVKVLEDCESSSKTVSSEDAPSSGGNELPQVVKEADTKIKRDAEEQTCAKKLKVLILSRYCRAPEQLLRIFKWAINLDEVNFSGCVLNDNVLREILVTLKDRNLSYLNLSHCTEITELGLIGSNASQERVPSGSENTHLLKSNTKSGVSVLATPQAHHKITRLARITNLHLHGIAVTDATIVAAFHFDDLRVIDLSECKLITNDGFKSLAIQNQNIERLAANSCEGLRDEGLTIMACYLQRLSHLSIGSCRGVTSLVLKFKHIKAFYKETVPPNPAGLLGCQFLQYLNVSNCVGIRLESINDFIKALGRSLKVKMDGISLNDKNNVIFKDECETLTNPSVDVCKSPPPPPPPPTI